MTKEEITSIILNLGKQRILLDTVVKSEKIIWGGVGDREVEEETILTSDGIVIEEKITEYGQFQRSRGGDVSKTQLRRYSIEESMEIILRNEKYVEIVKEIING